MLMGDEYNKISEVLQSNPSKIIVSNRKNADYKYTKTVIVKMEMRGEFVYQIERFTDKQAFHENIPVEQLENKVFELFGEQYKQMNIFLNGKQIDFKLTKKGKLLSSKHINIEGNEIKSNNRKKNYIIEEGTVIPPLVDLGVFTKEGKVVRSRYDKYKQINRFLELVDDVIKDYPKKKLQIIDFGCGKSYLTFILYYYLVEIMGYEANIIGLDLKEDVIRKCNETARNYGYSGLHFEIGDINGYKMDAPVDMVVTLHACDTATDYALYNAIQWDASIILSVPCCQHELNQQIHSDDYSVLTKYGIVKERISALMTDAIRGNCLQYSGYKTQLLEFIDIAHSPKNILIRAVKSNVSEKKRQEAKEENERLISEFHLHPTLMKLLDM